MHAMRPRNNTNMKILLGGKTSGGGQGSWCPQWRRNCDWVNYGRSGTHTHTHSVRSYQLHRCWRSLSPRLFARGRRLRDDADHAFELSSTRRSVTSQRREQCRITTGAIGAAASRRQIEGRVRIGHGPGQQPSSRSSSAGESRSITGAVWSGE